MSESYTIVIPEFIEAQLKELSLGNSQIETAAFMLAGIHRRNGETRLLCRRIIPIPPSLYRVRTDVHIELTTQAINGLLALVESTGLTAVLCHSHVGITNQPVYSPSDDYGERRVAQTLASFSNNKPIGSILISKSGINSRVWIDRGTRSVQTNKLLMLGHTIRTVWIGNKQHRNSDNFQRYDRQILALGKEGQRIISGSTIGVIGLGGTGSSVVEQLTRLGIGKLVLIDDDRIEESNLSRVYGSFPDKLSRRRFWLYGNHPLKKTEVISNHIFRISAGSKAEAIFGNVVATRVSRKLLECDAILLCTDEHWGRSVVNQICYQYMIPTINIGVRIDGQEGGINGATGSMHVLGPGKPCLWCYQYLNAGRIASESMLPEVRQERLREGYVEGLGAQPSVISLTTTMAGLAVTHLLHLLTGFRGKYGNIHCLRYDILDGTVSRGTTQVNKQCLCTKMLGRGDLEPLSTLDDENFIKRCRAKEKLKSSLNSSVAVWGSINGEIHGWALPS